MDLSRRFKVTSAIGFIPPLGLGPLKLAEGGVKTEVYRGAVEDMVKWWRMRECRNLQIGGGQLQGPQG